MKFEGPKTEFAKETHARKYRGIGESFDEYATRVADTLADDDAHFEDVREILGEQRFLPGGRIQSAVGSPRNVTAFNCFVSPTIHDSMEGIMDVAKYSALTMKKGGGIGYDFSSIRPSGSHIVSLDSAASGPISFMQIFDATCKTVASAGNRRGAQMGVLRVDHPDIEAFIEAKTNDTELTAFNISVGVTDEFMECVENNKEFELTFEGKVYKRVNAKKLYDKLMRATWDWAEPGVLFLDRINQMNNLYYCETISATNPCGEQPLPPNGACLLGSFNLTKYVSEYDGVYKAFNYELFMRDIRAVVRAMDNVIDNTPYPMPEQEEEAKNKRRMGLGVTGLANALEYLGYEYGSADFLIFEEELLQFLTNEAYIASSELAKEKGSFPLYDAEKYCNGEFFKTLDEETQQCIRENGIRNSHLISIAPTGTISLCADNISSGIEPVFSHSYTRDVLKDGITVRETVKDYGMMEWGVKGRTAGECTVDEHLAVLAAAQKYTDSACSKTINVGDDVTWDQFKDIYMKAWKMGCKGVTTFRASGKRFGILNETKEEEKEEAKACFYDPATGKKECE